MMWWCGNGMGAWGYTLTTISMVLFWGLLIFGLIAVVRSVGRGRSSGSERVAPPPATPQQVLAQRFAAGEIDEQEYRQRLDILGDADRPLSKP